MELDNALLEGRAFFATDSATLGTGASRKIMLVTPSEDSVCHLCVNVYATADVTIVFSEGADRTAGTAITARNRDRNCKKTAAMTLSHTPTPTGNRLHLLMLSWLAMGTMIPRITWDIAGQVIYPLTWLMSIPGWGKPQRITDM